MDTQNLKRFNFTKYARTEKKLNQKYFSDIF